MLRSGVSFPALMNLLGHSTPKMTLLYAEFTQTDMQREFHAARSQPRHLVPPPRTATSTIGLKPDLTSTVHALEIAQHVMASALGKSDPFALTKSDPQREHE